MMISKNPTTVNQAKKHFGRTLFNVLFASIGYVVIRMMIAPVRIKLMTALLSKEDYGLLTLVMLTVSFMTLLMSMGSLEFMLRKLPGKSSTYQFKALRTIATYFGLFALFLSIMAMAILAYWSPDHLGLSRADILACGIILVLTVHLTQLVYFLIGRSEYAQSRMLMLLYADAWFLPLVVVMWFASISLSVMLWLWLIWMFMSLIFSQMFVKTGDLLRTRPSLAQLKDVLRFGLPLMPMIMGEWIFQMQDRYVLLAFTDLESVANFTLCFNIAWVGFTTSASVLDVLITEFYKARNLVDSVSMQVLYSNAHLRKAFTMLVRYGLALGIPITLVLWIGRTPIILLLSDPKFSDAADLMRWVAPLPILYLMVILTGRLLMAIDRGRLVGSASLCAAGLHLTLHLLLTPTMAERGAALSGCIAYAVLAIYLGIRARFARWIDWHELQPVRLIIFGMVTAAGLYASVTLLNNSRFLSLALGGLICLAAMLILNIVRIADLQHIIASMNKSD